MQQAAPETQSGPGWMRPVEIDDALAALESGRWRIVAGGTDLYPALVGRSCDDPILDLSGLPGLRAIARLFVDGKPSLRIGATVTWSDLLDAELPESLRALALAAAEIGARQIQNRGTIGGNLCNASPAADSVPVLLSLDAQVELRSARGARTLALADFLQGSRRTALMPGELLAAVLLPIPAPGTASVFLKLGHRRYLVISIASASVVMGFDAQHRVSHCAVAVGSCSAVARRLPVLESRLLGMRADELLMRSGKGLFDEQALAPLEPIDDVRGTAAYRLDAAATLIGRGVRELAQRELR